MKKFTTIAIYVGVFLFVVGISFGAWYLKREINYNMMYKGMVQEEIRAMVKEEALKK